MAQFRNLVFEGGGVKGIAYGGALKALDDRNILPEVRRVAGTSAGAITAALLAIGCRSDEVADIISSTSFLKFMDDSFGVIRDANRLINEFGWYKGAVFADWMKKLLYTFSNSTNLTFAELHERAQKNPERYKDLFVIGTNLSMQMSTVYSFEETPDTPIWQAVRISMSIPLFFAAVLAEESIHVDGGVTWNYPIDLFDDRKYLEPDSNAFSIPKYTRYNEEHVYNKETLGFRLATKDEIGAEKNSWRRPPVAIDSISDYIRVFLGFVLDMANNVHLHKNDWHRTIFVDTEGVRTTDFDIKQADIDMLLRNGRKGVDEYFAWFNDPSTIEVPLNRITD